jgi:hypothetical protein|tara:strand:+ start:1313 stop:1981 length:669 start_codon:yes stop_codon:yes gene_type:complete
MNKITTISSMVALAIGLGACQSGKNDISLQPVVAYKSEQVSKQITNIPDWYLNMPTDEEAIYSSGSAKAPDLQLAVDIAILNAKTVLADRINGKLSSMTKTFIAKIGSSDLDTSVLSEIEKVSKNVVAEVDVAGYSVTKSDVTQDGTQYRAYVLLEYSNEEAIKIMMNRMRKDRMVYSRLRSTEAWKELENQVDKTKDEEEAQSLNNIEGVISGSVEESDSI